MDLNCDAELDVVESAWVTVEGSDLASYWLQGCLWRGSRVAVGLRGFRPKLVVVGAHRHCETRRKGSSPDGECEVICQGEAAFEGSQNARSS